MKAIGTLAGGIAHDFNNILTAIMGFTEIALRKVGDDSPVSEELLQVRSASVRARDLIRQILTFSRKSPHSRQPVQFSLIVREAARLLRSSFPATIDIRQRLESDAFINADPTRMHQVIMNLGTNAMQAMEPGGGRLTITLSDVTDPDALPPALPRSDNPFVRLEVRDTGTGIAPEVIDKIFDPYFTTKGPAKGSGMGLAVVHGIVESHGGGITVNSRPGRGSTFTVFLPATRQTQALDDTSLPAEEKAAPNDPCTGRRIMFVDDEETLRDLTTEFLESQGYTVRTYADGMAAWEAFEAAPHSWDLVITDQTMPRVTGIDLAARIRELAPDTPPILLSTGYSERYNREDLRLLGITDILQKPFALQHLLDTVRSALKSCILPEPDTPMPPG
jgi:CheY-like chemotaxis protein/two-component sensor histidine kinase